jgi:alpha-galactosidase
VDTAVKIEESTPWTASAIELFLRPARPGSPAKQFFLLPRTEGATALNQLRSPDSRITFQVQIDKGGYDFTMRLDLNELGIQEQAGEPFYMDMIVGAGALGDAHGACRVGWNNKLNSFERTDHYSLVAPQGRA